MTVCSHCNGFYDEAKGGCPVCALNGVKNGQSRVEDFHREQRYSFANNGSTFPEYCLGGAEHQWKAMKRPEMFRSGLHEDKCLICDWVHEWDDSD